MNRTAPRRLSRACSSLFFSFLILGFGLGSLMGQPTPPKVTLFSTPLITSLAGNGFDDPGYSGDGGPSTAALLNNPGADTVDAAGNVYIADSTNYVVRVVNTQSFALTVAGITIQPGNIATIAGTGVFGNSGDNGSATNATLGYMTGIAVDGSGNIYIVDNNFNYVRKISSNGTISAFAGSPSEGCNSGDNRNVSRRTHQPAVSISFECVYGVGTDLAGNVYIADDYSGLISKVDTGGTITTVAGNFEANPICGDSDPASGDGGSAMNAVFACAVSVKTDASGNLYITDFYGDNVRVVNMQNSAITVAGITIQPGDVNTIAGNSNSFGYSGDGGSATSALLGEPLDATVDLDGNVYIADSENDVVRKVDVNGIITTLAGSFESWNYYGDGGPALAASLYYPRGVAVDRSGNLYIADADNNAIRRINGIFGGSSVDLGYVNLGNNNTQEVQLYMNQAVTINSVLGSGDFSVLEDVPGARAKKTHSQPQVISVPKDMPAKMAKRMREALNHPTPQPKAVPNNNVGVCIGTFAAGDVCSAIVQFAPTQPGPRWFQLTATDNNLVNYNFGLTGTGVGSVASITPGIINTPPGGAAIGEITGMARDDFGNTYVSDFNANVVWKITPQGTITDVAGVPGEAGYDGDGGLATNAHFAEPLGLALDSVGNLYVADVFNNVIRKVDTHGIITTVVGNGTVGYSGDGGLSTSAQLDNPLGVLADKSGNLYIADTYNNVVRKVDLNGYIVTVAGNGFGAGTGSWDGGAPNGEWGGDNAPATQAELNGPSSLALDAVGDLYISDSFNGAIRKVDAQGTMHTIAGLCGEGCAFGYTGDGGPATSAELSEPFGVAVDAAGDVYIADTDNSAIRKVDVNGVITTVAFGGFNCCDAPTPSGKANWKARSKTQRNAKSSARIKAGKLRSNTSIDPIGDGGLATLGTFFIPVSVTVDDNGNFYLTDVAMGYVRMVDVSTSDMNFGLTTPGTTSAPEKATVSDTGNVDLDFSQISLSANFGWDSQGPCTTNFPVFPGNTCSLFVDFVPPAGGTYSGAIVLTDDAFNSPHTITLEGVANQPDYTVTSDPSALTIHQGQTGTAALTVTPQFGYAGTVTFACAGLPAHSACTFAPASAIFTGGTDPIAVTLTVTTTGSTTQAMLSPMSIDHGSGRTPSSSPHLWFLTTGLAGVVLFGANGMRRKQGRQMVMRMLFSFALLTGVLFINGCGSDSHPSNMTPLGNFSTTVTTATTATSGTGQHTALIAITILQ
jgi:NHL repeat